MVAIFSPDRFPYFVSGAAAAFDYLSAIEKALDEAELMLRGWLRVRSRSRRSAEQARTPQDHGKLYFRPEAIEELKWLLQCDEGLPRDLSVVDLSQLFDPIFVEIMPPRPSNGLHVVRALSKYLLPINFGFATEHRSHRRIGDLGLAWKLDFPAKPHFFA
jgi:hypothetical protein